MGPCPLCYILSLRVKDLLVLEKKIFESVLPYMAKTALGGHIGHVTQLHLSPQPMDAGFDWPSSFGEDV